MEIEEEIISMKVKLEMIWQVIKQFPNNVGLASNLNTESKKFSRQTTKEDIKQQLVKQWNKEHPNYNVNF